MRNAEEILIEDNNIEGSVKKIFENKICHELLSSFENLNYYLFKNYCMKGYLETCEPEYCSFKMTEKCEYIKLIRLVFDKYKINVIGRRIVE